MKNIFLNVIFWLVTYPGCPGPEIIQQGYHFGGTVFESEKLAREFINHYQYQYRKRLHLFKVEQRI